MQVFSEAFFGQIRHLRGAWKGRISPLYVERERGGEGYVYDLYGPEAATAEESSTLDAEESIE